MQNKIVQIDIRFRNKFHYYFNEFYKFVQFDNSQKKKKEEKIKCYSFYLSNEIVLQAKIELSRKSDIQWIIFR